MERVTNRLAVRLTSVVLVILAALLPLLYLGVSAIVQDGYAERFVNSVRSYSRLVADELEAVDAQDFQRRATALLDSVELSGQVVFAEIDDGSSKIHSSISPVSPSVPRGDDFYFGENGDQTYYISHTVKRPDRSLVLRLGFDESPTSDRIAAARRHVLEAIMAFGIASIAVAIWLSMVIARPMVRLQEAAKRIAGGDVNTELQMHSSIREVQELNLHLERMRQELVGTNQRLTREIRDHQASEQKNLALERRLLHRERIAAIGTLAGGVAHEFNNIMTPILLYSQLALQEVPRDGALAKDLKRIIDCTHRARSLVTRILTFSREMDSQQAGVFALRPPVEEALTLVRHIVPTNIEISFEPAEELQPVRGDPRLVHQIIINLCTNAYQAMRGHGGRLSIRLLTVEDPPEGQIDPGRYCLLEVSDTGHGMDQSVIAHIFEPFFTTRDVGDGTGLGLSVVHGIVASMGGFITVRSAVGRGTTFRVYLPAVSEPTISPAPAESQSA
jgi:signal transduction histidine kinase